jgi:hypothetical protein
MQFTMAIGVIHHPQTAKKVSAQWGQDQRTEERNNP